MTFGQRLRPTTWRQLTQRLFLLAIASVVAVVGTFFSFVALASPPNKPRFVDFLFEPLIPTLDDPMARREELDRILRGTDLRISVYTREGAHVLSNVDLVLAPRPPTRAELNDDTMHSARRRAEFGRFIIPLTSPSGARMIAVASFPPIQRPQDDVVVMGCVILGLVVLIVAAFATTLVRPLRELVRATGAFGRGELGARADPKKSGAFAELAREFNDMAERVAASMRAEKELLANVSHELRTPLARIRVALDLAAEGDAALATEALTEIEADLGELETLVTDILSTASLDRALGTARPLRKEPTPLSAVVERAAQKFRAAYPRHILKVHAPEDLPVVDVDPMLLRRAVDNVLDNAGKYSDSGSTVVLKLEDTDKKQVAIAVRDQGIGISAEDQAHLFTPFFRAERSRDRAGGGVGLGLLLARRIVEAHGGSIAVQSAAGEGTALTLRLPI